MTEETKAEEILNGPKAVVAATEKPAPVVAKAPAMPTIPVASGDDDDDDDISTDYDDDDIPPAADDDGGTLLCASISDPKFDRSKPVIIITPAGILGSCWPIISISRLATMSVRGEHRGAACAATT